MKCIYCGRETRPAVMLNGHAVGPKCAQKAGLFRRLRIAPQVRLFTPKRKPMDGATLDLFEVAA